MRLAIACAAAVLTLPAAAQTKYAVINSQKAVADTAELKKAQAELEAKYRSRAQALEKLQRELQDIQAQLENSARLSPEGIQELQNRGARRQREAQRLSEDLQSDVDRDRNDILQRTANRMQDVVKKIAEAKGLDIVLDISNTVYFKPALDITAEATAEFDKAHPVK